MQKDSLKKNLCIAALSLGLLYSIPSLNAYPFLSETQIVHIAIQQREVVAVQLLNAFLNIKITDNDLQWDKAINYLIKLLESNPCYKNLCNTLRQIQANKKSASSQAEKLKLAVNIGLELKKHQSELPKAVQKTLTDIGPMGLAKVVAARL